MGLIGAAALLAASTAATPARAQSGEITLVAYAGIFQDNYMAAVVQPFMAKFPNVKVNYFAAGTSAQSLGMLRAQKADPQTDVVLFDVTTAMIGNTEGLLDRLADSEAPNLAELFASARQHGPGFGPAVTFDHLVMIYDAEKVQPAPTKFAALWDPKWKGMIAIDAPPNILGLGLTAMATKMAGGDHTKSIDPGIAKLKELAPSVAAFETNPDPYTLVLNGTMRFANGWNARAQFYRDQSKGKLGVMLPEEGSIFQINTINVTKGAKNRAAAVAFLNYAIGQEAQKAFTEKMFYAPTNQKAQIAPDALARTAASPEMMARMIPIDWAEIVKVRDQWNSRWRREVITAK
ncbi:MAG: ABC transporter substrate-binding protein [Alphaproteobacteria bacterium]|nr:ABC transporter substrate-binding protein [Alphaproteobacteria bacterium]